MPISMILVLDSDARVPFHNKHLKWKCAPLKFIRRRETKPMLNKSFKPTCPAAIQTLPVGITNMTNDIQIVFYLGSIQFTFMSLSTMIH